MKTQDEWSRRTHLMDVRVREACKAAGHKKVRVDFSAYEHEDDEDLPIDNLDKIAVQGKCVLFRGSSEFYGGEKSKSYCSPVLENPTWLEAAVHANAMIRTTRDWHHVFFEGLGRAGERDGIPAYRFLMGS